MFGSFYCGFSTNPEAGRTTLWLQLAPWPDLYVYTIGIRLCISVVVGWLSSLTTTAVALVGYATCAV